MNPSPSPISETPAGEAVSRSRRLTVLPPTICLVGAYEIVYGLVMVPAEFFVELHVLTGATCFVVAIGLHRRKLSAWRNGAFLALAIMSAEIAALAVSFDDLEWPGVACFGIPAVLCAGIFVTLLSVRNECRSSIHVDPSHRRSELRIMVLIAAVIGVWICWLPDEPSITISTETTHITEPLDADGFPDYLSVINRHYGEGVTRENNAAILLLRASGPKEIPKELRAELYQRLGMKPLLERGDYFVSQSEFEQRLRKEGVKLPDEYDAITSQWRGLPWKRSDHPLMAKWLDANATPTRLSVEASRRTKLYVPLIILSGHESEPYMTTFAVWSPISEAARLLLLRAMQHIGEGRPNSARNAAIALHRLARLHAQSCGGHVRTFSPVYDTMAHHIDRALIVHGRLTSEAALAHQTDLYRIGPFPTPVESLDFYDRHLHLHTIVEFARGRWAFGNSFWDLLGVVVWENLGERMRLRMIDWNEVLRFSNKTTDRLVKIARTKPRAERDAAFSELYAEFRQMSEYNAGLRQYAKWLLTAKGATYWFKNSFADQLAFNASFLFKNCDRNRMHYELSLLGLGLTAYRADHGEYPETLSILKPKYARSIADDLYSGKPLIYKRNKNGFLLYSIGENGNDDGGHKYADRRNEQDDDLAIRIPPWPRAEPDK